MATERASLALCISVNIIFTEMQDKSLTIERAIILETHMTEQEIARTPAPPYYAVIFTSLRTEGDRGYDSMAEKMFALASRQQGFLGAEGVRSPDGFGVTICYWETLEGIKRWKQEIAHLEAQQQGREKWYSQYKTRICRVESDYGFDKSD
jgi:heme-degrading monooxygenase HmoA